MQSPATLFIDTAIWEVVIICITSFVGIFAVSAALEDYLWTEMSWYERILSDVGGLLLIYSGIITEVIGLGLVAIAVVIQTFNKRKAKQLIH